MSTTPDTPTPQPAQAPVYAFEHGATPFIYITRNGIGVGSFHREHYDEFVRAFAALNRLPVVEAELANERRLREGDNELIRALASSVGISIAASNKLLGVQWEQFHAGVCSLKSDRDTLARRVEELEAEVKYRGEMADSWRGSYDERGKRELALMLSNEALAGAMEKADVLLARARIPSSHRPKGYSNRSQEQQIQSAAETISAALAAHRAGGKAS